MLALATLALGACYPNPDALRNDLGEGGSRGQSTGGASGAAGGSAGSAGTTGAGGHAGSGGAIGAGGGAGAAGGHVGAGGAVGAGGKVGSGGAIGTGGGFGAGGSGGAMTSQCGGPACGGNLLGTWSFVNRCSATAAGDCAGEVLDASGVHQTGTVTFNSNGTYSTTETDTGTFVFDVPSACLNSATCADLQTAYLGPGFVGQPNPTLSSAACSTTTTGCRCLLGALGAPQTDTGTYVASGTSVTTTSTTGTVNADTYCVTGSILHLIYPTSTPAMPDESVFTKQ